MWKKMAEALGFNIPEDELDRLSSALDALYRSARQADRDLSTVDPVGVFRPREG